MHSSHDIVIVGGGLVGLTLALALAKKTPLSIAIVEAEADKIAWDKETYHHRVSAIALSSERLFNALNVWDEVALKRVSPFTKISVWDGADKGEIHFNAADIAEPLLGYIIENNLIQSVLKEKIKHYPHVRFYSETRLLSLSETEKGMTVITDRAHLNAKLVVGADGARSLVRSEAGIRLDCHDYEQEAIVATVQSARPHGKVASQVFLPSGPLAFLPLAPSHHSSIVWSLPKQEAERVKSLSDEAFKDALAQAFSYRLGMVVAVDQRYAFPLHRQEAKHYVKSRLALVGDAAHIVHPLAGQGVNMGLLDAASLVDVIVEALHSHRDYASLSQLRRYERWRRADNVALLEGIDMIKTLFASEKQPVKALRSWGVALVNQVRFIKNVFTQHAVGDRRGLPTLARSPLARG